MNYEIGDHVMKTMTGVCIVDGITKLNLDGVKKDRLYYLLVPVNDPREKIYIPVEATSAVLRKCMNQEETWKLIEAIPEIEGIWIDNEKLREQKYKEAVKKNDPYALGKSKDEVCKLIIQHIDRTD